MTTCFVFPGLNSMPHHRKYARLLALPEVRERLTTARSVVANSGATPAQIDYFDQLIAGPSGIDPYRTEHVHLTAAAILALQAGVVDCLRSRLPEPEWACGYSLGDVGRTLFAGCCTFADALHIIALGTAENRGVAELGATMLLVAGRSAPFTREDHTWLNEQGLSVSTMKPNLLNVSGSSPSIESLEAVCDERNWRIIPLLDYPAHSPCIEKYAELVNEVIQDIPGQEPRTRIFSSIQLRPLATAEEVREDHILCLTRPFDVPATMRALVDLGMTHVVNVGPDETIMRAERKSELPFTCQDATALLTSA